MSDPFVSNMLLHSCTLYIEGCALEYYIQQDQAKYFLIQDAGTERARDDAERKLVMANVSATADLSRSQMGQPFGTR